MVTTEASESTKGIVLYDGECPFCIKTVGILRKLDWFDRLSWQNCRDLAAIPPNEAHLDPARMIEEMHLLTPDRKKSYAGFRAFRWIAKRLPLLWLIVPLLYIPGVPQLGQRAYMLIAKNRFKLVPCHDGICTIPPKRK